MILSATTRAQQVSATNDASRTVANVNAASTTVGDTLGCDRQLTALQMRAAGCTVAIEQIAMSDSVSIGMHPVIHGHLYKNHDSVAVIADSLARTWLVSLQRGHVAQPRELLNVAAMQVQAGQDAEAQQSIANWLASPGITVEDTINALIFGIHTFLATYKGPPTSERFTIARGYERRLEAMPATVAMSGLFEARASMLGAFAKGGFVDSAISNGLRAFAMVAAFPTYEARASHARGGPALLTLSRLLVARPGGTARKDSILVALKAFLTPPAALVEHDPALRRYEAMMREGYDEVERKARWFGHSMPPFVATHWYNQPTPTTVAKDVPNARVLPLDDGIIRIIGFGWFTCGWCRQAMKQLQVDQKILPKGVQIEFYEWTLGSWGNDSATPEDEAAHLQNYWLNRKHFTFPIALWAGPIIGTPGEGAVPTPSPVSTALAVSAGPTFFVTDGHGVVRHWQPGYNGGYFGEISQVVDELVQERDRAIGATAPTTTSTVTR